MQADLSSGFLYLVSSLQRPSSAHIFILEGEREERSQLVSAIASRVERKLHIVSKDDDWKSWLASLAGTDQNGWVLFFDEADALFGKRTSVQDSHQKYADLNNSFSGLIFLGVNRSYVLPAAFTQCAKTIMADHYRP
jgi:hypothetical protein